MANKEIARFTFNTPKPATLALSYTDQVNALAELVTSATTALCDFRRDCGPVETVRNLMLHGMLNEALIYSFKAVYNVDLDSILTGIIKKECADSKDAPAFLTREED